MALYLIGDVQGCDAALNDLLAKLAFSPSRDRLIVLGDLVNRGPASLAVLRRLVALGDAAEAVLGNHDLHLLAVAHGVRKASPQDTVADILEARDRQLLLMWLQWRPLALLERGALMVHAGVLPQWTVTQAMVLAAEVQAVLRDASSAADFLRDMYGNQPDRWSDELHGIDRLRVIVNALTRLRFCSADGRMEFATKAGVATAAPPGYLPWFDVPARATAGQLMAFGHWSTLGWLQRDDLLSLDSGCVWGGELTAVVLEPDGRVGERISVRCEQAQIPGDGP